MDALDRGVAELSERESGESSANDSVEGAASGADDSVDLSAAFSANPTTARGRLLASVDGLRTHLLGILESEQERMSEEHEATLLRFAAERDAERAALEARVAALDADNAALRGALAHSERSLERACVLLGARSLNRQLYFSSEASVSRVFGALRRTAAYSNRQRELAVRAERHHRSHLLRRVWNGWSRESQDSVYRKEHDDWVQRLRAAVERTRDELIGHTRAVEAALAEAQAREAEAHRETERVQEKLRRWLARGLRSLRVEGERLLRAGDEDDRDEDDRDGASGGVGGEAGEEDELERGRDVRGGEDSEDDGEEVARTDRGGRGEGSLWKDGAAARRPHPSFEASDSSDIAARFHVSRSSSTLGTTVSSLASLRTQPRPPPPAPTAAPMHPGMASRALVAHSSSGPSAPQSAQADVPIRRRDSRDSRGSRESGAPARGAPAPYSPSRYSVTSAGSRSSVPVPSASGVTASSRPGSRAPVMRGTGAGKAADVFKRG